MRAAAAWTWKAVSGMRTFGLSGLMGACSGCASKRVGRFIIFGVGTVFASLQLATQYGYVTVHWSKVERDLHIDADCVASGSNKHVAKASDQPTVRRDLHCVLSVGI